MTILTYVAAEEFVATLAELGTDRDMITEVVHDSSTTIDSRHFAEEFLRRKKMADKGLIDTSMPKSASPLNASNGQAGGGWNEVKKKGAKR
jgi:PERQ amino acid-rich with GYF domain-containing protein